MSRTLPTEVVEQISSALVRPVFLFSGTFGTQTLNVWTGYGSLDWDSKVFIGNGYFVGPIPPTETEDLRAEGMRIELSGVPQDILAMVLNGGEHGETGSLWIGFLDDSADLVADPYLLFRGLLDQPEILESEESATVTLSYESRLIALERAPEHRYSLEGQRVFFPQDSGFRWIAALQDWSGFFGVPARSDAITS